MKWTSLSLFPDTGIWWKVSFVNITLNIGYGTGSELFLVAGIRICIWNADPHIDPGVKTTL